MYTGEVPERLNAKMLCQKWSFPSDKHGRIAVKRLSTARRRAGTSPGGELRIGGCGFVLTSPARSDVRSDPNTWHRDDIIGQAVHVGKRKIFVYLFIWKPFFFFFSDHRC